MQGHTKICLKKATESSQEAVFLGSVSHFTNFCFVSFLAWNKKTLHVANMVKVSYKSKKTVAWNKKTLHVANMVKVSYKSKKNRARSIFGSLTSY